MSPDGDEGFPGTLTTHVTYTLDRRERAPRRLSRDDRQADGGQPDEPLLLQSCRPGDGDDPRITGCSSSPIASRRSTQGLITTGELKPVDGTPFDFRQPTAIGARIDAKDEQITLGGGYDHNFVVNGPAGTLRPVAHVSEPTTGRTLDVLEHRAGRAVLHRELPGRIDQGQGRQGLSEAGGVLPRDAALPRLAEQAQLPVGRADVRDRNTRRRRSTSLAWRNRSNNELGATSDEL